MAASLCLTGKRAIPSIANRYQLKRVLAQGGVGVVFSALDQETGARVAVKLLKPHAQARQLHRARFEREARTASALRHPNLVQVRDFGRDENGTPFIVTELLKGRSLADELDARGTISAEEALDFLVPVIGGLAHAHDQGVVHRDVKPGNIFLCEDERFRCVPKLLDFGIATSVDATRLTESNVAVGTLAYMAPEQITSPDITVSIDVWAVGAVLYRCLSGSVPYYEKTISDQLQRITRDPVPPLADRASGLDAGFCAAVERALQHHLQRRYPDMRTMARALLISAVAAGIEVPPAPDPIGLPDWLGWREDALRGDHGTLKGY